MNLGHTTSWFYPRPHGLTLAIKMSSSWSSRSWWWWWWWRDQGGDGDDDDDDDDDVDDDDDDDDDDDGEILVMMMMMTTMMMMTMMMMMMVMTMTMIMIMMMMMVMVMMMVMMLMRRRRRRATTTMMFVSVEQRPVWTEDVQSIFIVVIEYQWLNMTRQILNDGIWKCLVNILVMTWIAGITPQIRPICLCPCLITVGIFQLRYILALFCATWRQPWFGN